VKGIVSVPWDWVIAPSVIPGAVKSAEMVNGLVAWWLVESVAVMVNWLFPVTRATSAKEDS